MIRLRPLAGALLITLLLAPLASADEVEVITPGGHADLAPPDVSTGPSDLVRAEPRIANGNSGSSESSHSSSDVDTQPGLQTMHFGAITLACKVASSSTDLVVINQSLEPLPPGTRIKWQLKHEGKRGYFAITGELGGGKTLVADDVLDGKAAKDEVCIARVI